MVDLVEADEQLLFDCLEICRQAGVRFAQAQLEAGADFTSIGDSAAGESLISPAMYARFAQPFQKRYKEALGAGTPRATEMMLDKKRWSVLEELETGTQFGLGRLIAYRLKLLLLERNYRFRPEAGIGAFTEEYARVMENAAAWTRAAAPPSAME